MSTHTQSNLSNFHQQLSLLFMFFTEPTPPLFMYIALIRNLCNNRACPSLYWNCANASNSKKLWATIGKPRLLNPKPLQADLRVPKPLQAYLRVPKPLQADQWHPSHCKPKKATQATAAHQGHITTAKRMHQLHIGDLKNCQLSWLWWVLLDRCPLLSELNKQTCA